MKRQLFNRVNFGNLGMVGGKMLLNAVDYDFELEKISKGTSFSAVINPNTYPRAATIVAPI